MLVRRILMVEDSRLSRPRRFVRHRGGLREHPDLILMDMNLPEMDGYELTRRMRELPELATLRSSRCGQRHAGDREKSLEAGCDGYIPKPIDVDALPRQIEQFLRAQKTEAGDESPARAHRRRLSLSSRTISTTSF